MGDTGSNSWQRHQQLNGHRPAVLHSPDYYHNPVAKKHKRRMEKALIIALNILGVSGYGLIVWLNIGDVKGIILFVIAALYGFARLFVFCIKARQDIEMKNIHIKRERRKLENEISP